MAPGHQIDEIVKEFVKELEQDAVAAFGGAGMSKGLGYVDWPEPLRDIAAELGLKIELEHDLISIAQMHVNQRKTRDTLAKKILQVLPSRRRGHKTAYGIARKRCTRQRFLSS